MNRRIRALPLTSRRWATLKAHFGNAATDSDEVPAVTKLIRRWVRAVGSYEEEYAYDLLCESYLHQRTILDVAYAVVPHLVLQVPRLDADRRVEVLDDIAYVDAIRRTPRSEVEKRVAAMAEMPEGLRDLFMQNTRDRHPVLPDDLAEAYLPAIARARQLAGKGWGRKRSEPMGPHRWRRHVKFLRAQRLSSADIRAGVELLTAEGEGGQLVHLGAEAARRGLLATADDAWLRRAKLRTPKGRLVSNALLALAWIEQHAPLAKMLETSEKRE